MMTRTATKLVLAADCIHSPLVRTSGPRVNLRLMHLEIARVDTIGLRFDCHSWTLKLVVVNITNFLRAVWCADCFFPYGLPFRIVAAATTHRRNLFCVVSPPRLPATSIATSPAAMRARMIAEHSGNHHTRKIR